jgi:hypothetical protein
MGSYPRPKTCVERRCWLWPETVAALREAIVARPKPKHEADAELVFVTKYGGRWFTGTPNNPLSHEMTKLLCELGIHRRGPNFYLRFPRKSHNQAAQLSRQVARS